jgi:hypothetical protein
MPRTKRDYAERLAEIEQREAAAKVKIDAIRAEKSPKWLSRKIWKD